MPLGTNDLKQIVLPLNVDPTTLQRLALSDGTTYQTVIGDINGGLGILNGLLGAGYLAGIYSKQQNPILEYAQAGVGGVEEHTEYGQPDIKRADTHSHMLPFKKFDRAMGWTWDYLKEAQQSKLDADLAMAMQDWRSAWDRALLTRLFQLEADAIGTLGKSLPFADGGTADTVWIPREWNGMTFLVTHNHYFRTTFDLAGRLASVSTMAETLWHHGHVPPYDLIIPQIDLALWTAVTGFIAGGRPEIAFGTTTALATVDQEYIGVFNTDFGVARVWPSTRLPTTFAGMYKRYGGGDQRSPLRVRVDPKWYNGNVVLIATANTIEFPLEKAIMFQAFGVGIGDRTNGTATRYAASGAYTTPVIG